MAKAIHFADDNLPMLAMWAGLALWIALAAMKAVH